MMRYTYRQRIKLPAGITVTISSKGFGLELSKRSASLTISKQGVRHRTTVSASGARISYSASTRSKKRKR